MTAVHQRRALTLQEMLIVVAVFLILAGILVLSSQHVMVKTRVSKTNHDLRELGNAINSFRAETGDAPSDEAGLKELLTPNSYLSAVPLDPFATAQVQPYQYFRYELGGDSPFTWVIYSMGPDGDIDFMPPVEAELDLMAGFSAQAAASSEISDVPLGQSILEEIRSLRYDPTNGINSNGDIFRFE